MELICGACHGRLLAEVPGTTVACPHCGTHLQTPAPPPPSVDLPLALDMEDDPVHKADAEGDTVQIQISEGEATGVTENLAAEVFPVEASTAVATSADSAGTAVPPLVVHIPSSEAETVPELPPGVISQQSPMVTSLSDEMATTAVSAVEGFAGPSGVTPADPVADQSPQSRMPATDLVTGIDSDEPRPSESPIVSFATADVVHAAARNPESATPFRPDHAGPAGKSPRGVSRLAFVVVLSYASAMTLACAFLLYQRKNNPGTLDLPDLLPPAQITKGKKHVSVKKYLPEDKPVPEANVLKLGESRQYGSVKVTPLKVTRGPVEFSYYKADEDQQKDPEGPVLKLHLKFENVSPDQEFIPLDSVLVYSKDQDRKTFESFNPHNFVSNVSDRGTRAKHAYVLNVLPNGSWIVKNQNLDEDLAPGQSLETFVPTTAEEIESLTGDLVWRVQFRKGYNRTSLRGVTTLIEVLFNSSEIVADDLNPTENPVEQPAAEPAADQPAATPAAKEV